ncbi:M-protein, striated muscle-like isoform X1 [Scleropages formosus]|uniref:Myomesin 1a (skelemin) n=1 Tax=Scleropages formosus TaxID=113540 RepID=A0A8C9WEP9_SCLFO|nr:M-protein, striated muscle-like isoform X1 [Scleropages formosus]
MSGSVSSYQEGRQQLYKHEHHEHRSAAVSSVSEVRQSSTRSTSTSTSTRISKTSKRRRGIRASVQSVKALEETDLRLLSKKGKSTYLALDTDSEIIGYVVPVFRSSHAFAKELLESQEEERKEERIGYVAMRNLFTREDIEMHRMEKKTREKIIRESAERIAFSRKMHEKEEFQKKMNADSLTHPPEFMVKPRSYTVWENQTVTFHCTVAGWPKPRVAWYKNNVLIDAKAYPHKYRVESNYNMHSLEIKNCAFEDTAQYRISALNIKGESSAVATVVVKKFQEGDVLAPPKPHGFSPEYGVTFRTHIMDQFSVSFGREGETMSLGCTVVVYPRVKHYQPEVLWYRNATLLKPSKWVRMHWSGDRATLTLTHLNKEDEGLYTLRINTKSGFDSYSAYAFVQDADVEVDGVPVAPLDVRCQDANKDYVVVTWKQPAVEGSSAILGYFVDRCEVGSDRWVQCNDTPVKFARFPVTGLVEGRSYVFRVRAINYAGISRPSRISEPVVAMAPAERAYLRSHPSAPWTAHIIVTEEEPTVGVVPGKPSDLAVLEATKSYVVLGWKPPFQRGHEGVMYYVEKCVLGTDSWQRVNTGMPVKSPRFALFDLAEGKAYSFRVRCCNSAGVGEPSDSTEPTTVGDKLDLPAAPGRVVATRNTSTSVVVSWEASQEAKQLVGYYIEVSVVGSGVWKPCNNKPVKVTRFVCHGLNTGDQCVFRVKAVNAAGYSQSSKESDSVEVKAAIAPPSAPAGFRVVEKVRDIMVVEWDQPKFSGGVEVTGYFLDVRSIKEGKPGQWHEVNTKAVSIRSYKVENLKENVLYQFQVRAVNMAGVSTASKATVAIECKEYTITVPGPPVGLHVTEVRKNSLVLLWEPPEFQGRSNITGYYVDIKEADAGDEAWRGVNEKAVPSKYLKVTGLKGGVSYVFRVCAQNLVGVGHPSQVSAPILAQTRPGTTEIVADVDDNGIISLVFECSEMTAESQFVWSKNYEKITDYSRFTVQTAGGKSRVVFKDLSVEDLGIYSCVVTHTDGVSSSYALDEEGLKHLLDISHQHKFPIIPFASELAVELLDKGRVRFWLQAEKVSANCQVDYVFNNMSLSHGEKYSMHFDKNTGIIEMFMESLELEDEGTFCFHLVDGKATGTSSLVLIGEDFRALQKESEFRRQEWFRKQGPHFVEYLTFKVTPECNVLLTCKVGNMRKDTEIFWSKDEQDIEEEEEKVDFKDEILTLNISKISRKDAGVYQVKLRDDRGKDKSILNLTDQGFQEVMNEVFRVIANSSTELQVTSTAEGIIIHTSVVFYSEELPIGWLHKDSKISQSDRVQSGVTEEQLWLKIKEPTEKDKGKYTINIFDGKDGVKRVLDLSGQVWETAYEEFQRLKAAAIAEKNRARVIGGLPDVVTIQEGKSLNLTGNIWGNPVPEVSWTKNEKQLVADEHYSLKFEAGKFASIAIAAVTTVDSGKYSLVVKNQYGTESGNFTVSVYIPESEEAEEEGAEKKDKKE